jgi:SAM-dependent methyltransferase
VNGRAERKWPEGSRFRFGANWQSFAASVTTENIAAAERGLHQLFPGEEIRGRRFLDIGCGAGLSALAACRLGAAQIDAVDIDAQSVAAAETLLGRFAPGCPWAVRRRSVFELHPEQDGTYDIVYAWGVLHHTGAMWSALEWAAAMVGSDGRLAIALYRRTPLCPLWRVEKRCYSAAPAIVQGAIRWAYMTVYRLGLLMTGRDPARYIAGYGSARGMDWHHDVHDWLGGYPYESASPDEVSRHLERLGLQPLIVRQHPAAAFGAFGSHCDEYVTVRLPAP